VWVNSAGNFATQHYEATFRDIDGDGWHNVSGSDETLSLYAHAGDSILVYLTWDAWPTISQDYDLFLYNSSFTEVATSENSQTGTQNPTEEIVYSVPAAGTYFLKILKYRTTSNLQLEVYSASHDLTPSVESSSLLSPADADSVITVGAIDADKWSTGPQEYFSSQGPTNDGRTKPDISGPDNVSTHTFGKFLGTSASSPHVAGACALVKQVYPNYSPDQIKNYLELNATDLGVTGKDNIYGSGLLNLPVIQSFENFIYFPHIASDGTWETEIGIINTSDDQSLSGSFKAYNNSGQRVAAINVSLTPKARIEMIVGDEFTNPGDIGYIIFESDSDSVRGYLKFYVNGKYRVAIPAASDVNAGDTYIPHIASNEYWTTGISILNTTSSSKTLTIEFNNGKTKIITIAANEHQALTIRGLFGGEMQPDIDSAVIKNGNGVVGLEIFGTTAASGLSFLSGILLKDDTTTTIYYPHIASNSTWGTGIVAYNPFGTSSSLTITPFSADGTALSSQMVTLSGQEKYIGLIQDLNLPGGTAWFSISASSPITGFELFSTKDGNQLGGYTGVGISGTDGVFAKIDKNGGTGIAFVNIENAQAAVTMSAHYDNGNTIATESLYLNAHEKVLGVPSNLFSQDISNATYIAYSSDRKVVGFQLNVSSDNMMLDALPGLRCP
jgi:hypothetical protein